jgi:hypothetical protein
MANSKTLVEGALTGAGAGMEYCGAGGDGMEYCGDGGRGIAGCATPGIGGALACGIAGVLAI